MLSRVLCSCEVGGPLCLVDVLHKLCYNIALCSLLLFVWGGGDFEFYFYLSDEEIKKGKEEIPVLFC